MSRKSIFIVGAVLLVLGAVGSGILFAMYQQEIAETETNYGQEIVMLCNPIRGGGEADEDLLVERKNPRKAVVFIENQRYLGEWHDNLKPEWQADTKAEVDVVVCLRDTTEMVERCAYGSGSSTSYIERIQRWKEIHVFDVATQGLVAEMVLAGEDPAECPDTAYMEDGETDYQYGLDISFADFENALHPYIEG
jgi:hypothetical protein